MITAIIVDDEIKSGELTALKLQKFCPEVEIIANFSESILALEFLQKNKPDVVFLDIEMPRITGLQLAEKLKSQTEIVFVTAHQGYSIEAIRLTAFDYLLKPINEIELRNCIKRLSEKLSLKKSNTNQKSIDTIFDKIALPSIEGTHFISINEIVLVEADSNYTVFYFMNKNKMVFSKTLKQIEQALFNYSFFRPHKSYLINLNFIERYNAGDDSSILMQNGKKVELSRNLKKEFVSLFSRNLN